MTTRTRLAVVAALAALLLGTVAAPARAAGIVCDPAYPTVCIPAPPPGLACADIQERDFQVEPPDPHHFDSDHDGVGCESSSAELVPGPLPPPATGGATGPGGAGGAGRAGTMGGRAGGALPFTGASPLPLLVAGLLLVGSGGVLLWRLRRQP